MKTILWIYTKSLCPEVGGTERVTSLVQRGLRRAGYRCMDILVLKPKEDRAEYHGEEIGNIYVFLKENQVDVVINQDGRAPDFLRYFLDNGGERWHKEGGRIVSCLHFHPRPVSVHYQFSIKKHKTLHDYYVIAKSWLFHDYLYKRDRKAVGKLYGETYDMSDVFVMLSERYRDYIVKGAGIMDDSKLVAINNPLTFEEIADASKLDKKQNTILVVSRLLDWQKRIFQSIKVWEVLSKKECMKAWNFKIVGDGEDMANYQQYVREHHIERISFEGQQSSQPYYEEAKIFLMTSKTEGWGLTITEALQYGVVPVAFDTSEAFQDIIDDGENGFLVKEGAINTFASRIEQLANDEMLWRKMAEKAFVSANRFSLNEIIKKWEKII